jgi:hypothetical protein
MRNCRLFDTCNTEKAAKYAPYIDLGTSFMLIIETGAGYPPLQRSVNIDNIQAFLVM